MDDLYALRRMQRLSISEWEEHITCKSVHLVPTTLRLPDDMDLTLLSLGTKFVPSMSLIMTRATNLAAVNRFAFDSRLRNLHLRKLEPIHRRRLSASLQQTTFQRTSVVTLPRDNLTKPQRKTLRSLSNNPLYVTLNADKNLGLTVMSTEWYEAQARAHLNDVTTYRLVTDWPLVSRRTAARVIRCDKMSWPLVPASSSLAATAERARKRQKQQPPKVVTPKRTDVLRPCRFYIIPKVHKTPTSSRPIAAAHSFVTTRLSQRLTPLLQHMVNKHKYIVPNSIEFLRQLEALPKPLPRHARLFSADVESLYPNIDTDFALATLNAPVLETFGPAHGATVNHALDLVMRTLHVEFRNTIYLQTSGCAMGTPVAPPYANLFMHHADSNVRTEFAKQLPLLCRYIDDYAGLWLGTDEEFNLFTAKMNAIHPRLRIVFSSLASTTSFLDVHVTITDGHVTTRLFRKSMNRYLFLPLSSQHPVPALTGWLTGEAIRMARICSSRVIFEEQILFFRLLLRHRGFPARVINRALDRVMYETIHARRFLPTNRNTTETVPPTVYLPLLFQPTLARAVKRTLPTLGLFNAKLAWRINPSLGQLLSKNR